MQRVGSRQIEGGGAKLQCKPLGGGDYSAQTSEGFPEVKRNHHKNFRCHAISGRHHNFLTNIIFWGLFFHYVIYQK